MAIHCCCLVYLQFLCSSTMLMGNPSIKPKSQLPSLANGLPPPPFWSRPMRHCGRPINQWNNGWCQPVSQPASRCCRGEETAYSLSEERHRVGKETLQKMQRHIDNVWHTHLWAWKLSRAQSTNARKNSQARAESLWQHCARLTAVNCNTIVTCLVLASICHIKQLNIPLFGKNT